MKKHLPVLTATSGDEGARAVAHARGRGAGGGPAHAGHDRRAAHRGGARASSPTSLRMLMTAYSDLDAAIDAINLGQVQRYMQKPWEPVELLSDAHPGARPLPLARGARGAGAAAGQHRAGLRAGRHRRRHRPRDAQPAVRAHHGHRPGADAPGGDARAGAARADDEDARRRAGRGELHRRHHRVGGAVDARAAGRPGGPARRSWSWRAARCAARCGGAGASSSASRRCPRCRARPRGWARWC